MKSRLISPRQRSMVFPVSMPVSMNPRALMTSFRGSPVSNLVTCVGFLLVLLFGLAFP